MNKNSLYLSVFLDDPETKRHCSRLLSAINNDDFIQMRKLLTQTPELVHMPYGSDRRLPLQRAVLHGKLETCEILGQFGAEITYVDDITNDSLLHFACRNTFVDIIEWLIGLGAPMDYQNSEGLTPLMECIGNMDVEGSTLLLTASCDTTIRRNRTGFNAVHMAIAACRAGTETYSSRHLSLIRLLINFTAQQGKEALDSESADRDTPLLTAIQNGNFTAAKWLLENGASPNVHNRHNYSPICLLFHSYFDLVKLNKEANAVQTNNEFEICEIDELIRLLIEKGADLTKINNRGETPLHLAIGNNLTELALEIAKRLRGDVNVLKQLNSNGHSILHMLARSGQDQKFALEIMAKLLGDSNVPSEVIDHRAKDDSTALFNAIVNKKLDLARYLIEKGADIKAICNGETVLHAACRSRKIEAVQYALQQGIDVNAVNRDYQSAAHLAAASCPLPIMMALMEAGADVNLPTKPDGYSPFFLAVRGGHLDLVEAMLPRAKLDQLTKYGETAMAEAGRNGNLPIMSALTVACADRRTADGRRFIDLYESRGKPPLVAAAERGHRQLVDVLLKNGANPNLVILDGNSALYAAIGMGQIATVRLLLAWGADLTAINRCGPRLCCFSYVDPHPHLEMNPFFCAAKFQNLNLVKLCAKFYQVPQIAAVRDLVVVFSNVVEEDNEGQFSAMFITNFLEYLTNYLNEPPPSLQHQCRVKIRTMLGSPLPLRLAFVNIPLNVKEYILMRQELGEGAADDPQVPNPPPLPGQ